MRLHHPHTAMATKGKGSIANQPRAYLPACVCEEDHRLVLCVMKLVQEVNQVAVLDLGLEAVQSSNFTATKSA